MPPPALPAPNRAADKACAEGRTGGAWPFFCGADMATFREQMQEVANVEAILDTAELTNVQLGTKHLTIFSAKGDTGANLVINEHVKRDAYRLSEIPLGKDDCFLDVGANLGLVVIRVLLGNAPPGCVIAVEAAPVTYIYQQLNLWANVPRAMKEGRVTSIHAAVGERDGGTIPMVYNPKASTATAHFRWDSGSPAWRSGSALRVNVPVVSINTIIAEATGRVRVLKIDCEGCEYKVIPALSDSVWGSFDVVTGEVHAQWMGAKRPSREIEEFCLRRLCAHRPRNRLWHLGIAGAPWCHAVMQNQ